MTETILCIEREKSKNYKLSSYCYLTCPLARVAGADVTISHKIIVTSCDTTSLSHKQKKNR